VPQETVRAFEKIAAVAVAQKGEQQEGLNHVQEFLNRFGYMPEAELQAAEPDVLGDPTAEALTKYQELHGLEVTGNFDEATRDVMTRPRCAMPDLDNGIAFSTTCSWNKCNITYAFDTGTADVAGTNEFQACRNAFQTWAAAVPGLSFTEVAINANPDVVIGWRPANDPDYSMVGGTLAHADFPPDCGVVTNSLPKPVHFDDTEHTWVIGAVAGGFDIETVALHEMGHILGLAHSNVNGAVMFPTVSSNFTKRALTADDIGGVQALYPDCMSTILPITQFTPIPITPTTIFTLSSPVPITNFTPITAVGPVSPTSLLTPVTLIDAVTTVSPTTVIQPISPIEPIVPILPIRPPGGGDDDPEDED